MAEIFDLAEFARSLQRVSNEIKQEVGELIVPTAEEMARRLAARYPIGQKQHPGIPHMKEDIRIRRLIGSEFLLPVRRVVGPRLAYIWQNGTRQRHDSTRKNANRGRMPAADRGFFERTALQVRAEMLNKAQSILDRDREIK